ncbi:MAG: guanylate kinase [Calditrichia bacterium]
MTKQKIKDLSAPQLVVLSAPSGGGKTTICRILAKRNPDFRISVSVTSRPPRPREKEGTDYFFVNQSDFLRLVEKGDLLEYEQVHGNYYGTLKSKVEEILSAGHTVLFDIDVNGALHIKESFPQAILIFIRPPSVDELERRLKGRKSEDEVQIRKRLQRLPLEYEKSGAFDYDIINSNLEQTVSKIERIIRDHQTRVIHVSGETVQK